MILRILSANQNSYLIFKTIKFFAFFGTAIFLPEFAFCPAMLYIHS